MTSFQIALSLAIAAAIPIIFLILAYSLDLYRTNSAPNVILAFLWGGILSLGLAYLINTRVTLPLLTRFDLSNILLYIVFAPIVEELLKLMPLVYYLNNGKLTFFVDGAIYGFASGIGFSIGESFIYINSNPELAIPIAIGRALSTSLMHGSATALVGIGYGLAGMYRVKSGRALSSATWLVAVATHGLFNALALSVSQDGLGTLGAFALALAGFELMLTFIRLGLQQEKRWLEEGLGAASLASPNRQMSPATRQQLEETLRDQAEVPLAEIQATQDYEAIDEFLDPLRKQFPDYARDMERIIFQQAQASIKRRLMWEVNDHKLRERLQAEIVALETSIKQLRKQVGPCATSYLDCVFDENGLLMQVCVDTVTTCAAPWDSDTP